MTLGLTVVTHTNIKLNRNISRCVQSVKNALPENGKHIVIGHSGDYIQFLKDRHNAMSLDDVIVFVDDDDYISEDSLKICMDALVANDVGIAFTYEIKVMKDGSQKRSSRPFLHSEICKGPEIVHHMVAYRTKYISERSLNLALEYNCGIEWTMRTDAALAGGAVFVPIDGYYWVQHDTQSHKIKDLQNTFRNSIFWMSQEMKTWGNVDKEIPEWKL